MSKKKIEKTLVEKILDQNQINYEPITFEIQKSNSKQKNFTILHGEVDENIIYKTLVLEGNKTGPLVGVVPITEHLSEKKLAKISGNKKVNMVPLKNLIKTTGYEHGANTPIGIWHKYKYPIYIDKTAENLSNFYVSSGKIAHSIKVNPKQIANLIGAPFVDLLQE